MTNAPSGHEDMPVTIDVFKALMSTFPSGVAVVTTTDVDGTPHGLTCTSLCGITDEPSTLGVCLHNRGATVRAVRRRERFAVNFLHTGGRAAAEHFASGAPDRFERVDWRTGEYGLPLLPTASHGIAECRVRDLIVFGNHTIALGEIASATTGTETPLLYGARRFAAWPPDSAERSLKDASQPTSTDPTTQSEERQVSRSVVPPDLNSRTEQTEGASYKSVLRLDELLRLQQAPVEHDELMFVVVHQVHELWFKLMLHELEEVRDLLLDDRAEAATHLVERCATIQNVLVSQWSVLDTMLPADFLAFRDGLEGGSGFESVQYREIEYLAGLKDETYLERAVLTDEEHKQLRTRLEEQSVREVFLDLVRRRGFGSPAELSSNRYRDQPARDWDLLRLAEKLLDLDQAFATWRARHTLTVERQIGTKSGTGGSSGVNYLRSRMNARLFPELWELRGEL
ncbi:tryptophan 2,3-dioxygenase [Actinopolyspora mzabensis]|uniref:Tryptophan 2,3-dioxygenase n=1 Tax=Actinopolyspora mzabensis TaxID=995066 RepID=A0A1G9EGT6_ACTMZ|nr:tryptophan 2,3-dioxygenase family protein [Actinopolyspora mzabensis]SDK75298.1 tryptophan 2,3-dioxygenase [Actinopolyspora mzabensis]